MWNTYTYDTRGFPKSNVFSDYIWTCLNCNATKEINENYLGILCKYATNAAKHNSTPKHGYVLLLIHTLTSAKILTTLYTHRTCVVEEIQLEGAIARAMGE